MPLQLRHVMPTHQLFIQMRLVLSLHPLDPSLYRNVKKVDEGSHEEESADGQTSHEEIILSNVLSCIGLFGVVEIIGGWDGQKEGQYHQAWHFELVPWKIRLTHIWFPERSKNSYIRNQQKKDIGHSVLNLLVRSEQKQRTYNQDPQGDLLLEHEGDFERSELETKRHVLVWTELVVNGLVLLLKLLDELVSPRL